MARHRSAMDTIRMAEELQRKAREQREKEAEAAAEAERIAREAGGTMSFQPLSQESQVELDKAAEFIRKASELVNLVKAREAMRLSMIAVEDYFRLNHDTEAWLKDMGLFRHHIEEAAT